MHVLMLASLEIAAQGRAGCQGSLCKDNSIKIQKGELRMGVFVTIKENQSWRWKHWQVLRLVTKGHSS